MKNALFIHLFSLFAALLLSAGLVGQTTTTFNFTGGVQQYVVPPCVTAIEVVAAGAQGGGATGGSGAVVTATIDVTPGQIIEVYVGGTGNCPGAGFNGGGLGTNAVTSADGGCGGGGASDIRFAPYGLADRVIVAGGGGGMGGGNTDAFGGGGGCPIGLNGDSPFGIGGIGATATNGGAGGDPWIASGNFGAPGSLGQGGNGGTDPCHNIGPGGGGGGGFYGGGGGGSDCFASGTLGGGGGGGGSSLIPGGGGCLPDNNGGNGYVTITPNNTGIALDVQPAAPTICAGDSVEISVTGAVAYTWAPAVGLSSSTDSIVMANPTATQTYIITGDDLDGCEDTISVTVEVIPEPEISITPSAPSVCPGGSIVLTASGADTYAWAPSATLDADVGAAVTATPNATETYTVAGTVGNCTGDTAVTVAVLDPPTLTVVPDQPQLCDGEDVSITVSGATTYSWSPATGLDDTTDSIVTANPQVTTDYTITGTDVNGCADSLTITATVLPLPDVDAGEDAEICPNTDVQLDGTSAAAVDYAWSPTGSLNDPTAEDPVATPDATTTYTLEVTDADGCTNSDDVTIDVVDQDFETTTTVSLCEGETYVLPDGTEVDQSGTYENLFTSSLGCDSLVITELEVLSIYDITIDVAFCAGEDFALADGQVVDEAGSYTVALQTASGCDSILTYEVTVFPNFEESIDASICETQTYTMPDGTDEDEPGLYTFAFTSINGCDSIVNVDLTVEEATVIEDTPTICANESYTLPDGETVSSAGDYEVVINSGGCDTIYQIDLSVNPVFETTLTPAICAGETYTMPDGSTENVADTYSYDYQTTAGCDSSVIVVLDVLPLSESTENAGICDGETYTLPDGTIVEEEGIYPQLYTGVNGCDSILNIDLEVFPNYNINQQISACDNDNVLDPFGNPITSSGSYTLDYTSIHGCDSIVNLTITVNPAYSETIIDSICSGDFYVTKQGQVVTQSGIYQDVFESSTGCDSVFVYELSVLPKPVAAYAASPKEATVYDGPVRFTDESEGATAVYWDFGPFGTTSASDTLLYFGSVADEYEICIDAENAFGCIDQYCSTYIVREEFTVYIPNAFSPNGDGINDLFFVQGKDIDPENFELQIFNRWGEVVFETNDITEKWDGSTPNGEYYGQDEVYVYRVIARAKSILETQEFTGSVTVLR